jgi:hypothetical protein
MSFATKDIKKIKKSAPPAIKADAGETDRTKNKSNDLLGYFKKSYSGCYQFDLYIQ